MKIIPGGDGTLVVEFGDAISEEINDRVHALAAWLRAEKAEGITEVVPTFRSLMICYDVKKIRFAKLKALIERFNPDNAALAQGGSRVWQIPCCYAEEYAPDLADMAALLGLSREEIIAIHSGTDYKIYMLGFLPGFVYLGGMDDRIAAPRLTSPRLSIPEGSVAIGGSQTGVYPIASPGGWRIIGSTPVKFYDPQREQPILCTAGDYIRFVPVSKEQYDYLKSLTDYMPGFARRKGGAR